MTKKTQDIWSQWILKRRYGGDKQRMQPIYDEFLFPIRDKVLSKVALQNNEVLLDVGCGDGLIGFGALEQSNHCQVIFSDISQDLLDETQSTAQEINLMDRSEFLLASASELSPLGDASIDAVTTRSVLIYVADKKKSFSEFHRVLKPGGRLSIFEPINNFPFSQLANSYWGYDITPVKEIAKKIVAVYKSIQPAGDPMLDFDDRDLINYAEEAGFREAYLELLVDVHPIKEKTGWEVFLTGAANPKIPTLEEAMQQTLTSQEIEDFTAHLRPLVEAGEGMRRIASAYLWAIK